MLEVKLPNKIALVTGANSGIGRAIALLFAREGADVVVHYWQDVDGAQRTATEIRACGRRAEIVQSDLSEPQNASRMFDRVLQIVDRIDVLVNNAGTGSAYPDSLSTPLEDFMRVMNVNLVSPWVLCQRAATLMAERGGGVIINISSVHEDTATPGGAAYGASKAGLRSIMRTLAVELAPRGIRVNNIAPGTIVTPMTEAALLDPGTMEYVRRRIPMGRPGMPEEVANVALFLASDDASYVTGATYYVDGGLLQRMGGV
ncbi:short-chain dehydrogenase/reductase SDR [Thermobaculum terrenum ATCC BAA-798]|uniref:Short-chain dehydrogenase/reductase SDR n=1 Tax=Thermobaculum terrenum (strain ATCC BAA-798 / CCMEE 7001 / YNP1) TaxID=525904 RepID=D1CHN9_THET1|nr:short-chain dehydrogenase/reductase SDR [Thermobaculum terrenum ATCC BAA-798]